MAPVEGFEHLLRAWCAYVPHIEPVARALEAALSPATTAPSHAQRFGTFGRRCASRSTGSLAADRLPAGWTVDAATDWRVRDCSRARAAT
jgi:hypothetical protein